ncbi:MAG: 30S ribosomal protein S6 [Chloroflexota bacterium]|jgi:small subunit ribosomal protein S6
MRKYELTIITHPDLDKDALAEIVNKVQGWITEAGGKVEKVDSWGKRMLAYPIRKQKEGQYVYFEVEMSPALGATIERNLRYVEAVMRFLIIVKDE